MPQKFLVDGFKWVENTFQFSKNFKENYTKDSDKISEVNVQIS